MCASACVGGGAGVGVQLGSSESFFLRPHEITFDLISFVCLLLAVLLTWAVASSPSACFVFRALPC